MTYNVNPDRYKKNQFRRSGKSGLDLPAISLGLWQNFGGIDAFENGRGIIHRAFDRGVTHFDLSNNYGPPPGSAEENFGKILASDFKSYRDELIISTKAGYKMWSGPYGIGGSRKYLIASLDQSLLRMGLNYVDIFYSHRVDPSTPLEETMLALHHIVQQGKALYVGISSYSAQMTRKAFSILKSLGTKCLIHQPSYSMLNRWIEDELLDTLWELGIGCIAFSPLAQGMLTDHYINGIKEGTRATKGKTLRESFLSEKNLKNVKALNEIAIRRGQSLAQMALTWVLRDKRITSALIGVRTVEQLDNSLDALNGSPLSSEELIEIDRYAENDDINLDLWRESSSYNSN
ncbi:MAG: L-glyceraldehyde 3-phosphate reductase [Rhodospirillaceae bacterium]|jgi:L-glyceraldehyde 3-phosphate reductase|nr:L-glyceraldehyde 3-phosphate reductase [Rhodospirillaceae bacterium]